VLEPPELRERVAGIAARLAAIYHEPTAVGQDSGNERGGGNEREDAGTGGIREQRRGSV
jgi:hypothetical protein